MSGFDPEEIVQGELVDESFEVLDGGEVYDEMGESYYPYHHDPTYGTVSTTTRPSISYVNEAGVPEEVLDRHFRRGAGFREIASIIEQWSQSLASPRASNSLDLFNRTRFRKDEQHHFATMARVAWVVENDDVLETLADVIEGLMWRKCRFELIESDEEDFWNQWARRINLDAMLREMGREEFKLSQFYVGLWWEKETFSVRDDNIAEQVQAFEDERKQMEYDQKKEQRDALIAANAGDPNFITPPELPEPPKKSKGPGNRSRKKKYAVTVPTSYTIFDPTKVLPVGQLMFGKERFAYVATREEHEAFISVMQGNFVDATVMQLLERRYTPTGQDRAVCADLGVDPDRLWLMKSDSVFRHTVTKAQYERFANVRLKTILPIIEMKEHLRNSDRATLIGNTNFIVVITKGTDKLPAKPSEIEHLQAQARVVARLPVLVGDHRLHVEIVSPKMDMTLIDSRWQVLDSRLVFAALKTFSPVTQGGNSSGAGVKEMSLVVSTGLESRRHMMIRTLEKKVFAVMLQRNPDLEEFPGLSFMPKRITLDFQADIMAQVLKLRDRGDISRETTLEELNYDQDTEVVRRGRERVLYDPIFESQTPHSSPASNPYGTNVPPQQQPNFQGNAPAPANNLGPSGQPRTEGGRPSGVKETQPRARKGRSTT